MSKIKGPNEKYKKNNSNRFLFGHFRISNCFSGMLSDLKPIQLSCEEESFRASFLLGLSERHFYLDYLNPIKYYLSISLTSYWRIQVSVKRNYSAIINLRLVLLSVMSVQVTSMMFSRFLGGRVFIPV